MDTNTLSDQTQQQPQEETYLVAVYGSLRKGLHNHDVLGDSNYVGTFNSLPQYTLFPLGGFPGVHNGGDTSVVMEVYECDSKTMTRLDGLEGYRGPGQRNFYDRQTIETPYGTAFTYIYAGAQRQDSIEHGDWVAYLENKSKNQYEKVE